MAASRGSKCHRSWSNKFENSALLSTHEASDWSRLASKVTEKCSHVFCWSLLLSIDFPRELLLIARFIRVSHETSRLLVEIKSTTKRLERLIASFIVRSMHFEAHTRHGVDMQSMLLLPCYQRWFSPAFFCSVDDNSSASSSHSSIQRHYQHRHINYSDKAKCLGSTLSSMPSSCIVNYKST